MAPATRSTFFHPEHSVVSYHYDGTSTYYCAARKLIIIGTAGYRCGKCNFNIHEACFSLPKLTSSEQHPQHKLTLTRLTASRTCDVCKDTSPDGRYLYCCVPCSFDAHPRCVLPQPQQQAAPPPPHAQGRGWGLNTIFLGIHLSIQVGKAVDAAVTGGLLSPVLDAIQTAVDSF